MKRAVILSAAWILLLASLSAPHAAAAQMSICPISLTNPDGQELTLEKYDLRVAVNGALSLTEMEMVFRNPQPRQMEGRFTYILPAGATISRFAKEVNGRLMEGEVVEKLRAQSVYTEILHTMRDPALLETDQGNRFSARVFPISANGTVRLVLSYSQALPSKNGERKLTVPLAGLPQIGEFSFSSAVRENAGETVQGNKFLVPADAKGANDLRANIKDYKPEQDIELVFKAAADAAPATSIKAGNFQMITYRPTFPQAIDRLEKAREWVFYFDTSASNADQEARRLEAIGKLLPGTFMKGRTPKAFAFDVSVGEIAVRPLENDTNEMEPPMGAEGVVRALRARHALGATNLEAGLKHIGDQARAAKEPQRFVLVSDGIPTLGAREIGDLLAALGDWPQAQVLHALVIGAKQDEKVLNAIVEKTQGRVVQLPLTDKMESELPKVLAELQTPLGASFEFYDEAATWIYPKNLRDVRPGDEVIVFSQLKDGADAKPGVIQRGADGKKIKDEMLNVKPAEVADFAPLLHRQACRALLDHLEKLEQAEKDAAKRAALHTQRIELSTKNRVLCPLTSLLVLETERDYRRFGIERTSLADIMVVGKNGIELKKRGPEDVPAVVAQIATKGKEQPRKELKKSEEQLEKADKAAPDAKLGADVMEEAKSAGKPGDAEEPVARDGYGGGRGGAADRIGGDPGALALEREGAAEPRRSLSQGATAPPPAATAAPAAPQEAVPAADAPTGNVRRLEDRDAVAGETRERQANQQVAQNAAGEDARARATQPAQNPGAPTPGPVQPTGPAIPVVEPADLETQNRSFFNREVSPEMTPASRALAPAPENKVNPPAWVGQFSQLPGDPVLEQFHAKVVAAPRDRGLRNSYADVLLKAQKWDSLQGQAFEWLPFDPENPQVYEFLGKSATGLKDYDLALRAMTSIAEIAPNRAALLGRAGWLLMTARKYEMAAQMFREAIKNRKDDCNLYRGLAFSLWLDKKHEDAVKTLEDALAKNYNSRYGDVKRVLREELGYILRSWAATLKNSDEVGALAARAAKNGISYKQSDALRVTLCWETDACDVDLHVTDPNGEECFYSHMKNKSGLQLYSDQTQGLGPEVIRCDTALKGLYHVAVNYFSAGAMGVSRGVVVVFQPVDGVVERPVIAPFCLVPGGPDMRHLVAVEF